jgi:hypothetical protein
MQVLTFSVCQGELDCCAHMFCFSCAKRWSESENTCPLCKQRFKSIVRIDLSQPAQVRRAEKIRVAQRNQSGRNNVATSRSALPSLALHYHMISSMLFPVRVFGVNDDDWGMSLARRLAAPFTSAPFESVAASSSQPAPVVDLMSDDHVEEELLPPAESNAPPAQIIDLTLAGDDSDDDDVVVEGGVRVFDDAPAPVASGQVIDLTADEWDHESVPASLQTGSSLIVIEDE